MQVVGSQGDIQPFVTLGLALQKEGHRVRIATHPDFQAYIQDCGLDYFNIGGNPAGLMAYMVKSPSLFPTVGSILQGEVRRRRHEVRDMMTACWKSCFQPLEVVKPVSKKNGARAAPDSLPFVADAIIANPPSFAHIHCAEKLGIPLHMVFTYVPLFSIPCLDHVLKLSCMTIACRGRRRKTSLTRWPTSNQRSWTPESSTSCLIFLLML